MKNWLKRVTVGLCATIGVVSLGANVVQYRMYSDLKDQYVHRTTHLQTVVSNNTETIDEKNAEIKSLQSDLATEEIISNMLQRDLDDVLDATLEWYKKQAAENGFDPEAQDWMYGGAGRWYFFYYDTDDNTTDAVELVSAE